VDSAPRPNMLAALRKNFRQVLRDTVIVTVVLGAASFLIPNRYTASAVLLPPSPETELGDLFSTFAGGGALSRAFGLETSSRTSLYLGVLRSDTIKDSLVRRFDLLKIYGVKDQEKARKKLISHSSITLTNDGFVCVSVTERGRGLAADLANAYVEELDQFLQSNSNTTARRRREFLEQRLVSSRLAVVKAEDALRDYQVQKRMPVLGADADRSADAAAELMGQKLRHEVELGTLESVARGFSPRMEQLQNEIHQIDAELMKIPPAATAMARLFRDMKIQERVLLVLTEEYERARILEFKNTSVVEVVDHARPPLHKSQPRRSLLIVATFVIVLAMNSVLVWAREGALHAA